MSEALRGAADAWKARLCCLATLRSTPVPLRNIHGASLDAIGSYQESRWTLFSRYAFMVLTSTEGTIGYG